jgi:iron complex transport system substrate-binding protein
MYLLSQSFFYRTLMLCGVLVIGPGSSRTLIAQSAGDQHPQRIVSLNVCTDQLLLLLVERRRIASLTWLSADPQESPLAHRTAGVTLNYGQAEDVIPLRPDLIIAGTYTARFTVELLRRRGYRVQQIEPALSLDQLRTSLRAVAALVGAQEHAERLLSEFDRSLAALASTAANRSGPDRPNALVYAGKGFAAGVNSLENDLLTAVGLRNQAAELGLEYSGYVDLETLLSRPPDILVISRYHFANASLATRFLRHPALQSRRPGQIMVELPGQLLSCTPHALLQAARRLHRARRQFMTRG